MKVRMTIDVSDADRRAAHRPQGRAGLATRAEVRSFLVHLWQAEFGEPETAPDLFDDLGEEPTTADAGGAGKP